MKKIIAIVLGLVAMVIGIALVLGAVRSNDSVETKHTGPTDEDLAMMYAVEEHGEGSAIELFDSDDDTEIAFWIFDAKGGRYVCWIDRSYYASRWEN